MRATRMRALLRFFDPFFFLANRRCAFASFFSSLRKNCGLPMLSPVERITIDFNPRSSPTCWFTTGKDLMSSSTRMDMK